MDHSLYEEHALLERDHWWFVGRRSIIERVLAHHLPPQSERRILDVGCGTGGMLPMLARFGRVEGLETEQFAVDRCHAAFGRFDVRLGAIPDDVPADGSFDVVTAFDVIEHIDDDRGAVESLRGAARPGGVVVISVPALRQLWSEHDVVNGHKRRYDGAGLTAVVAAAGLELRHLSYFNSTLFPVVAMARLTQRLRRPRGAPRSDFAMPPPTVNRVLTRILVAERTVVARWGLPIGVSLVAVARRPATVA
jgi:SAM-dependent methyltransferase